MIGNRCFVDEKKKKSEVFTKPLFDTGKNAPGSRGFLGLGGWCRT
jgi:hypothetical protein